jgi:hypothetical protein
MPLPAIHRVVTGHDAHGKSILVSNGPLSTIRQLKSVPGMFVHEVWETRGAPAPIDNGADPTRGPLSLQAPPHGTLIRFVDFPPDSTYLDQAGARMKELFREANDIEALTATAFSPHPMMHRSEAVDYGVVIEGEIVLVLDGSEVVLRAGSVLVLRGANHAWANRTHKTCRMLFIQIDGEYDPAIAAALAGR